MSNVDPVEALEAVLKSVNENLTASWTAVSMAIENAEYLLSKMESVSAAQYEKFGRQMADLASDYSRGLASLAEGSGSASERQMFVYVASSMQEAVDNLRTSGAEAYAKYGQDILEAGEAARTAKLAAAGGAAVDLAELSVAVNDANSTGDWSKVGGVSAGIVSAAGLGEFGAFAVGAIAGFAGVTGSPVVVATFVASGALAYFGGALGQSTFGQISEAVNSLFSQSRDWRFMDPLAIDLDSDGIEAVPVNGSSPVLFDHDGDGTRTGSGWLKGDDAWLVLDKNANGRIDNGSELFGADTVMSNGQKASNGFAALADLDRNHDGFFDSLDAKYSQVQIWRDLDQDGVSEAGELQSLDAAGIASISLASTSKTTRLDSGNVQTATASYTRSDGSSGVVASLDLVSNPFYRAFSSKVSLNAESVRLPNLHGSGMVRDLQEAASLNPDLVRQVNAFKGMSRADMMVKVDQLVADWAATADFTTSREKVEELGMRLICLLPGIGSNELRALQLVGQPGYDKNTVLAELCVSGDRYEFLHAQVTEMGRVIEILEAFNGQNYLSIPDDRLRIMAAGSGVVVESPKLAGFNSVGFNSAGTFMVIEGGEARIEEPSEDIFVVISLSRINQSLPLEQAFAHLKESVYDALVLQTRLKDYIECVQVKIDPRGITLDFTAMDAYLDQQYQFDPVQTFIDCMDLQKVGSNLSRAGWQGAARLSAWASDMASKGQLGELDIALRMAFESSSAGTPQVRIGTSASDSIFSNAKRNLLLGMEGNDYLCGGDAEDILDGGTGNDALNGGAGSDVYLFGRGSGRDVVNSYDPGTAKTDAIQFGAGIAASDVKITRNNEELWLSLTGSNDRIGVIGYFSNDAAGAYKVEEIRFPDGTVWDIDAVKAMAQQGTSGNDTLYGYAVADTIHGGEGNDVVLGFAGNDLLWGDGGADTLSGREGADLLYGGDGNDDLSGDGGNDTLDGGTGNDWLIGGLGSDVYLFQRGSGQDRIREAGPETGAIDAIRVGADIAETDVRIVRDSNNLVLSVAGTSDKLTVVDYFNVNGVSADTLEEIRFASGTSWDVEAVKALVQQGTRGNDKLYGYAGPDTLSGDEGGDAIEGYSGDDVLSGDGGSDSLSGGAGADLLQGGEGSDDLYGGEGNDTLDGGAGNDRLSGGVGNDVYQFGRGGGLDTISNYDTGLTKTDAIQLGEGIAIGDVQIIRRGGDLVLSVIGTADQLTISGYFSNDAASPFKLEEIRFADGALWDIETVKAKVQQGTSGNDYLYGYAAADTISGGDGADSVEGAGGDDTLFGNGGMDYLRGGGGADALSGGEGADSLFGDEGNDSLQGDGGNDGLYGGAGVDILRGGAGNDVLDDRAGNGLFEGGSGNDSMTGGTGIEVFIGGADNDTVVASAGNDIILFNKGDGKDTVIPGEKGNDILSLGGGLGYDDLSFIREGAHLVLRLGAGDQITFRDWYATAASRPVATLQVIAEAWPDDGQGGSDPIKDQRVERFDFAALVTAFDAARAADPAVTAWTLANTIGSCQLGGSDTAAFGGDLAYQYGLSGTVEIVGTETVVNLLSDGSLGAVARDITSLSSSV